MGLPAIAAAAGTILGMRSASEKADRLVNTQGRLNEQAMETNKQMAMFNNKMQKQLWKATGPVGQMKELKAAGLNPALLYGMGGGGGQTAAATPAQGVSGGQAQPDNIGESMSAMGMQLASQLNLMKAQKENIEADTANKKAEAGFTTGAKTGVAEADIKSKEQGIKESKSSMWLKDAQRMVLEIEGEIKEKTFNDAVNRVYAESWQATHEMNRMARENRIGDKTEVEAVNQIRADLAKTLIEKAAIEQGIKVEQAQIEALIERVKQEWSKIDIEGDKLTEQKKDNLYYRTINDIAESTRLKWETAGKVVGAVVGGVIGGKLLKGGRTVVEGFGGRRAY